MAGWVETLPVWLVIALIRGAWLLRRDARAAPLPPLNLPPPSPRPPPDENQPVVHRRLATTMAGDYVTLTGEIQRSTGTLRAPLSGTECVAYLALTQAPRDPLAAAATPAVLRREMKIVPLVIAVEGGTIRVEGDCAVNLRVAEVGPPELPRVDRTGVAQYAEAVIRARDRVWVTGVVVHELAGEHGYRDQPVQVRLDSAPNRPLMLGRARRGGQRRQGRG